jgi:hypothetical protein
MTRTSEQISRKVATEIEAQMVRLHAEKGVPVDVLARACLLAAIRTMLRGASVSATSVWLAKKFETFLI